MKKAGWVHPNEGGFYIGKMLGEAPNVARTNGKATPQGSPH
jgi:hypothetical protein